MDTLLRLLIRSKIVDGRLPVTSIPRARGGLGNGETCEACGKTITKGQFVIEAGGGKPPTQFHVECFRMWDEERRALRSKGAA